MNTADQGSEFEALRRLEGLPGESQAHLVDELIEVFEATTLDSMVTLWRLVESPGGAEETERAAHALKGSAASLGVTTVVVLAAAIEACARDGRMDGALASLERLAREIEPAFARLRQARTRLIDARR